MLSLLDRWSRKPWFDQGPVSNRSQDSISTDSQEIRQGGEDLMAKRGKTHLSKDHWIEQEGVTWEQSDSAEDSVPHPQGEFDLRIRRPRTPRQVRHRCPDPVRRGEQVLLRRLPGRGPHVHDAGVTASSCPGPRSGLRGESVLDSNVRKTTGSGTLATGAAQAWRFPSGSSMFSSTP